MGGILANIFKSGAGKLVDSVGGVLDNLITNKEELAAAKLALEAELHRHTEAMEKQATEAEKMFLEDRANARSREVEVVRATGRLDFMLIVVGSIVLALFVAVTIFLLNKEVPKGNEHITINLIGMLEASVIAVVSYYFGSSAGSRAKDLKGK